MIVLVTGTPGSGKTLFAVSKIIELQKDYPDRQIYADIDGLMIDGVEKSPEDWRETPDNSIVIYDEAQQHERFRAGTSANRDAIVQALQVHRHTGHDIWFITQSPRFLNAFVLDLVGEHYHLHRPYGAKLASVYYWRSVRKQPQSLASRELAENEFLFRYPKSLFDVYKSATQHNVKFKLPKKLIIIIVIMILMILFVVKMFYSNNTQNLMHGKPIAEQPAAAVKPVTPSAAPALTGNTGQPIADDQRDLECRKAANVQKPECVAWFDNLSKYGGSVTGDRADNTIVTYDPARPYDLEQIQQKVSYTVTAKPVFSGCMLNKHGRYVAYTQQGTILEGVSQEDCRRLVVKGERPFNYFQQSQPQMTPVQQTGSQPVLATNQQAAQSPVYIAQQQQYQQAMQEYPPNPIYQ